MRETLRRDPHVASPRGSGPTAFPQPDRDGKSRRVHWNDMNSSTLRGHFSDHTHDSDAGFVGGLTLRRLASRSTTASVRRVHPSDDHWSSGVNEVVCQVDSFGPIGRRSMAVHASWSPTAGPARHHRLRSMTTSSGRRPTRAGAGCLRPPARGVTHRGRRWSAAWGLRCSLLTWRCALMSWLQGRTVAPWRRRFLVILPVTSARAVPSPRASSTRWSTARRR